MPQIIGLILTLSISTSSFANFDFKTLTTQINSITKSADGNFGVYIKSMSSGESLSYNADRTWYLASGVKLAVALELYNQVNSGKISLSDKIQITSADHRDGAGVTSFQAQGSFVTYRFLLEQMMVESDNTATDLLIKKLGLENINSYVTNLIPKGFNKVTSILDVRKEAYAKLNEKARELTNADFIQLKRISSESRKLKWLRKRLNLKPQELKFKSLREAFESYYEMGNNSATLIAYSSLLESVLDNQDLLQIMARSNTGQERIKSGLKNELNFAHKTGTQLARICDMGIIYKDDPKKGILITMCAEKFKSQSMAEKTFKKIGSLIRCQLLFPGHNALCG